jgi:NAD(P)-dependent dehydrogenase (short-subunit alcohol dehydrogenase family)
MASHRPTILVTGASRGLGRVLVDSLLRLKHDVFATMRGDPSCLSLPDPHPHLVFLPLDVTSSASRAALRAQLEGQLGADRRLDLLINNAGVYPQSWEPASFSSAMSTNVEGPLALTRELLPLLCRNGGGGGGGLSLPHVVNVSSSYGQLRFLSALSAYPPALASAASVPALLEAVTTTRFDAEDPQGREFVGAYKLSKAALNRGTQLLAEELRGSVRVTAVDPGWCATDMGGKGAPRTPSQGAASILWAAAGPEAEVGTGRFIGTEEREIAW